MTEHIHNSEREALAVLETSWSC